MMSGSGSSLRDPWKAISPHIRRDFSRDSDGHRRVKSWAGWVGVGCRRVAHGWWQVKTLKPVIANREDGDEPGRDHDDPRTGEADPSASSRLTTTKRSRRSIALKIQ